MEPNYSVDDFYQLYTKKPTLRNTLDEVSNNLIIFIKVFLRVFNETHFTTRSNQIFCSILGTFTSLPTSHPLLSEMLCLAVDQKIISENTRSRIDLTLALMMVTFATKNSNKNYERYKSIIPNKLKKLVEPTLVEINKKGDNLISSCVCTITALFNTPAILKIHCKTRYYSYIIFNITLFMAKIKVEDFIEITGNLDQTTPKEIRIEIYRQIQFFLENMSSRSNQHEQIAEKMNNLLMKFSEIENGITADIIRSLAEPNILENMVKSVHTYKCLRLFHKEKIIEATQEVLNNKKIPEEVETKIMEFIPH